MGRSRRTLTLRLAPGSRMPAPMRRNIEVKLGETSRKLAFDGSPAELKL